MSRGSEDRRGESRTLNYMGNTYRMQDDYDKAYHYYTLSLNVAREIGDRVQEAKLLRSIGGIFLARSSYAEAHATYEQGLRLYREVGDRQGEGAMLRNLAPVAIHQGNLLAARDLAERALAICRDMRDRWHEANVLCYLGLIAHRLGDCTLAQRQYEAALAMAQEIGHRWRTCRVLGLLGLLYHHPGDQEQAQARSEAALNVAEGSGLQDLAGYALKNRGHALAAQEQWLAAAASYERALTIRQQLDQPHLLLECRVALLHVEARYRPPAVASLREVAETLSRGTLHGLEEPARTALTLYQLLEPHDAEQATTVLAAGYARLEAQADALPPPLRHQYLTQVAAHRILVAAMVSKSVKRDA